MERDNNTGKQFSWECIKNGYILESKVNSFENVVIYFHFLDIYGYFLYYCVIKMVRWIIS